MKILRYILNNKSVISQLLRKQNAWSTTYLPVAHASFLSESYRCEPAWKKRLESSIIKKIDADDLFYQMDKKYQVDKLISAIDVDLYVNKVVDAEVLDEIEEMIHRLRKSPATADSLDSTSHAVIRLFLSVGATDNLIRILNDRMNYGIFVDFYAANLLMDEFLDKNNFRDAVKIASLLMLEEDFSHQTSKLFALLSCLKYLNNPTPEPWDPNALPPSTSKEETKLRIPYLRNAFYDYHFDIVEPHLIIGRTLFLISRELTEDDVLRRSVELLGNVYSDKWDYALTLLEKCINSKWSITEDALTQTNDALKRRLADMEASSNKSIPTPKLTQFPGVNLEQADIDKFWSKIVLPDYKTLLTKINSLLEANKVSTVKGFNSIVKTEELLKKAIAEKQHLEIEEQLKVYNEWEEVRMEELHKQLERFRKDQLLAEIEQKKEDLQKREETIFFFDNEEEWMMKQPPGALDAYTVSFKYVPSNYAKFVRSIPPKKKKRKSKVAA